MYCFVQIARILLIQCHDSKRDLELRGKIFKCRKNITILIVFVFFMLLLHRKSIKPIPHVCNEENKPT